MESGLRMHALVSVADLGEWDGNETCIYDSEAEYSFFIKKVKILISHASIRDYDYLRLY